MKIKELFKKKQQTMEMIKLKENEYQCFLCKGIFENDWTDEEAEKELKENFKGWTKAESELVCDDCYNKILSRSD